MKISEMKYERPDIKEIKKIFKESIKKFSNASSFEEQDEVIKKLNELRFDFDSMLVIASIKYTTDTENKAFEKEEEYFDDNFPVFSDYVLEYYKALLNSEFKDRIIDKYGKQLLDIAEVSIKIISSDTVEDLKKENRLENKYDKLKSSARILFDGKERNLPELSPYLESKDREQRKNAFKAYLGFFSDNSKKLDKIFDDLVKTRDLISKKLGYKNFIDLGHDRWQRTDYGAKMISQFRKHIRQYFVPLAVELRKKQRKRIGVDKLMFYDFPIQFISGNAAPKGSPGQIKENAKKMYNELSPETGEFFNFMVENDLMDLYCRKGKAGGGYSDYIPKYKSPFIFANMNGTSDDIETLAHEAGHAFQEYSSRDIELMEYLFPSAETEEIQAHGMEFLTYPWMDLFFKEDAEKYRFSHLSESVLFLTYVVLVDDFEHWIYENPGATAKERKSKWTELEKIYRPEDINYGDNEYLAGGGGWQRQSHIYTGALYYINYSLALICGFQFWSRAIHNKEFKNTLKDYIHFCKQGGKKPFLELLKEANLESPFVENVIKKLAREIEEYIDCVDDSAY